MCDVVWNVGDMNGTRRNGFIPAVPTLRINRTRGMTASRLMTYDKA